MEAGANMVSGSERVRGSLFMGLVTLRTREFKHTTKTNPLNSSLDMFRGLSQMYDLNSGGAGGYHTRVRPVTNWRSTGLDHFIVLGP